SSASNSPRAPARRRPSTTTRRNALALPELPNLPSIYQEKSGLWRVRGIGEAAPGPPGLRPTPQPVAATSIPTFFDQLFSYTTATELIEPIVEPELAGYLGGMPNLDRDDVIAILQNVP